MDAGRARPDTDFGRQRLELKAGDGLAQARNERLGFGIAGMPVSAAARGPAAGLDGEEVAFTVRAVVVLDVAGADHDVADAQRRIEAAGDAAQHQGAAFETVEQQRGGYAGIDLARTRFDEHRLAAGDLAAPEAQAADLVRRTGAIGQMGELLGQGRYDAQKPVCHARMGYKVAARMSTALPDRATLRDACTDFAREAAREIMRIYAGDLGERAKADKSPVTDADHAAEAIIVAGLRKLTPDRPVVAEEEMAAGHVPTLDGGPFWLVDPLDGTKEFIKRNGEFTVNIALIENGQADVRYRAGARDRHGVAWRPRTRRRQERGRRCLCADQHAHAAVRRAGRLRQPQPRDLQRPRHLVPQQRSHGRRARSRQARR